jgi:hypothetical protein
MSAIDGCFTGFVNGQTTGAAAGSKRLNYRSMENRALLTRIEQRLQELGLSAQAASLRAGGSPDLIRNLRRAVRKGEATRLNSGSLESLARALSVPVQWLMTGEGPATSEKNGIPLVGIVGAGNMVVPIDDAGMIDIDDQIGALTGDDTVALQVRGDSQYPRFLDGEIVLVEREPTLPDDLVGEYAAVDTDDGRRLIKIVRRGSRPMLFNLESHNAPLEEDVRIVAARRYKATVRSRPHVFSRRRA